MTLLITPDSAGAQRLQSVLDAKRDALSKQGVVFGQALGRKNHTRLYMATTAPERVEFLRWNRGFASPEAQMLLANTVRHELLTEVERSRPDHLVLACSQLADGLLTEAEVARLKALLDPVSEDVRIVLHVEDQARALARHYAEQVFLGRIAGLEQELALAGRPDWVVAALASRIKAEPRLNRYPEIASAPVWLDYAALLTRWENVFGAGSVVLRPQDDARLYGAEAPAELAAFLGLDRAIGKVAPVPLPDLPSDATLARARQMNALFEKLLASGRIITRMLWRRLLGEVAVPGAPVAPGALAPVSRHFAKRNAELLSRFPDLGPALTPDPALPDWDEPDPTLGFRASQYLTAFLPRIDKATQEFLKARAASTASPRNAPATVAPLSPEAERLLPPLAKATYAELSRGRFAPHNGIVRVNEEELGSPYPAVPPRPLSGDNTGNVIVGCMKNEGPYIVEWIAYHRAIGVDNFLIYTNGCEDGTAEILDRLQELGVVQHRNNDEWKGKSPQQAALNKSLKEPLVKNADWLIHIDIDEFMNIRTGQGTLPDLFARIPDATAVAMTWRLFGHGGVTEFVDEPVIGQFTRCAPAYCPKPHTVWGFKTMFRNDGAYAKMSCHRPNKLAPEKRPHVRWVNGSGQPMADSLKDRGWRNGVQDIGYDLIQLNHYALRSAESFLIKRQRGRALHVDRSIGLNYWIRMDWSDATDLTIQRNLPRLRQEMDRLLADDKLATLHRGAVDWHRKRAETLRREPEFEELLRQALETRLSGMERVAYALALDLES
nr:glycosyltransferase family 2 protein [Frigidibacter sp. ROC022]